MAELDRAEWGLTGVGNIGGELMEQVAKPEVADRLGMHPLPVYVLRKSGLYLRPEGAESLDDFERQDIGIHEMSGYEPAALNFIALPSDEESAGLSLALTKWMAREGSPTITAEKGMLSFHWDEAKAITSDFRLLGYNASVGGGNRLIEQVGVFAHDPGNIREIHLALNGTLTYMLDQMSGNDPVGIAAKAAERLGYADPLPEGAGPLEVIRGEAEGDIPKKTSILFNSLGLSDRTLDWADLRFELDGDQLSKLEREVRSRRFIVSIYRIDGGAEPEPADEIIGGFDHRHEDWHLVGGFRRIGDNPMFDEIGHYSGTANGGKIGLGPNNTDGVYPIGGGPGAGPTPTVNTMLDDALKFRTS